MNDYLLSIHYSRPHQYVNCMQTVFILNVIFKIMHRPVGMCHARRFDLIIAIKTPSKCTKIKEILKKISGVITPEPP
jgi:hypothetical protein